MKYLIILFLVLLYPPTIVGAANSNFSIRTFVGSDSIPPTTPILNNVTAITSTQIAIDWTASTDDVFLAGYRVFRDGLQIATTTQISFNDTGLLPETSYVYNVDAFDSFDNLSSSSALISTTTLPIPVILPATTTAPATNNSSNFNTVSTILNKIEVITTKDNAQFSWQTSNKTRFDLSWGRTGSYELGTISSNEFGFDHSTVINHLESGTIYLYQLKSVNSLGISKIISSGQFMTLEPFVLNSPVNVGDLIVDVRGDDVKLHWRNDQLPVNYLVRIVRNYLFYPLNIQAGAVVYEGQAESFYDQGALKDKTIQYYTVFVIDQSGSISSGAIGIANKRNTINTSITTESTSSDPGIFFPDTLKILLTTEDVNILQSSTSQVFSDEMTLKINIPYLVTIPASRISKDVKIIIISLQDPSNNHVTASYLLKLNKTGDAYETVISASKSSGVSKFQIGLFSFADTKVLSISGRANFVDEELSRVVFPDEIALVTQNFLLGTIIVIPGALFLWWIFFLIKRRSEDK